MTQIGPGMRYKAKQWPYGSAPQKPCPFFIAERKSGKKPWRTCRCPQACGTSAEDGGVEVHTCPQAPTQHTQSWDRLRATGNSGCLTYNRTRSSGQLLKWEHCFSWNFNLQQAFLEHLMLNHHLFPRSRNCPNKKRSEIKQIKHVCKREPREQSKPGEAMHALMQESDISLMLNILISHRTE